jgi:heme A synthase
MISTLLTLFIILAIGALLWWGVSQLPLPPVVKTVLTVVFGLVLLLAIYHVFTSGSLRIT